MPEIGGIILAAGQSRRMGRQKLLLPFGEQALVTRVAMALLGGGVSDCVAVVRGDHEAYAQALGDLPVRLVVNPNEEGDMLSSVRCGLCALPESVRLFLVALGDQPGVSAGLVREMVARQAQCPEKTLVVPVAAGKRGHPLLIGCEHRERILRDFDGCGLRELLRSYPELVLEVPVECPETLMDMDHPPDYEHLRAYFAEP